VRLLYDQLDGQEIDMKLVSVAEAKAKLSELVTAAEAGETIEITRRGKVVARLAPAADGPPIDIEAIRRHQESLKSPVQSTERELREWKDDERY
jgi:prevent-host-death family protein